jgi:hypothetical protein
MRGSHPLRPIFIERLACWALKKATFGLKNYFLVCSLLSSKLGFQNISPRTETSEHSRKIKPLRWWIQLNPQAAFVNLN